MQKGSLGFGPKKSKIVLHQEKSDNAFNLFKKTVNDLNAANTSIDTDIAIEEQIIEKAVIAKNSLIAIKAVNAKFADKIKDFFEI
jgi:hypothetical protein